MLNIQDLLNNFSNVIEIDSGVARAELKTSKLHYFYVRFAKGPADHDLLLASQDEIDDEFAKQVFDCTGGAYKGGDLSKIPAASNTYGFSSIVVAPPTYHSYFEGILDDKRKKLVLCIPAFECEFSGREKKEQFAKMLWRTVPILSWSRNMVPKILLRFDNPKTGGGTGKGYVLAEFKTLLAEVENIRTVELAFVEVLNFREDVLEVISDSDGAYTLISNRDDSTRERVSATALEGRLWSFLTE